MNKAEQLRKITNEMLDKAQAEKIAKHKKYANKIINGKCHLYANLGKASARVKVKKKYSADLVVDALVDYGFTVITGCKNGREILTIKW